MKLLTITNILLLAIGIAACDNTTPTYDSKQAGNTPSIGYPGKPSAAVEMSYQLLDTPELGLPVQINISLTPGINCRNIKLSYSTSSELVAGDNLTEFNFANINARQTISESIRVIPQSEGLHYINLVVTLESTQARAGSRSFSIPVKLGNIKDKTPLPQKARIKESPEGERIIIQRGRETRE